jgi:dienelactone hydrolase
MTQNTGRRVTLPKPNCVVQPNDCAELDVINTLDGFNVQPRLSIPFDGPIDVTSVTSQTVFLVCLGSTLSGGAPSGKVIGINQVVWDVATTTLHVESDEILDQHTRYALIVSREVRDAAGDPVEADESFRRFRHNLHYRQIGHDPALHWYRKELLGALVAARALGMAEEDLAVASVFTTQSVTAALEKIRDQIARETPAPADFALEAAGTPAVYPLAALTDLVFVRQTGTAPSFSSNPTPFMLLSQMVPGAVGAVAFGKYESPDYLTADRVIPLASTRLDTPQVQRTAEIFFNLVLPAGSQPPGGWPVAIVGHGSGGHKQDTMFLLAAKMAAHGIATIGINAVGRGFGPLGTLTLLRATGSPITLPAGGRGSDTNGDGQITSTEGGSALAPYEIVRTRDARIQTAADLMQLVRVIEVGMDVDGDGVPDLDPARIYYVGNSFGANYGTVFLAAEPRVRAGVLVSPGGPSLEAWRLSPLSRASSLGPLLAARVPSLINISGFEFNENLPLRDQPPVVNTVPGAVEIQELLDNYEWVGQAGDVVPYGVYLRRAPLEGVTPKAMLIQFARGDRNLPNPTATAILRAGDLADRATYYRFDLFLAGNPTTPPEVNDPHDFIFMPPPFLALPPEVRAAANAVSDAAQEQIAVFFASDGVEVIDPDGPDDLFETPIVPPLPEDAVFFP